MCRYEGCRIGSQLEDAHGTTVISNGKSLFSGHSTERCEFEGCRAFVTRLALIGKGLIETLGYIDVLHLPSVAKVAPNIDAEIGATRGEALVSLVNNLVLVRS